MFVFPVLTHANREKGGLEHEVIDASRSHRSPPPLPTPDFDHTVAQKGPHRYEKLSKILHAALPSQHDTDIIVECTGSTAGLFHQMMWIPYAVLFSGKQDRFGDIGKLPSPTDHPTLIGRKMLMLAMCLQHLDPTFAHGLKRLDEDFRIIKKRLVDVAVNLVNTSDELVGSVEGMQCILLEGIYQANNGNLRRGWLAFRRAMVVGQLMGLHRGRGAGVKSLSPDTIADLKHMWFRIVYADRYLSLMLGLPVGSHETNFTNEEAMKSDTSNGRLERLHTHIALKLLQRNDCLLVAGQDDCYTATQEIDADLQAAARTLPSKWWLTPLLTDCKNNLDLFQETIRLVNQFFHYNLLNQLHLPYMLRDSPQHRYDYSKMTCVNASREQLTRFISFRSINLVAFSCRGVDFFAFMASMTLLLAHLDSHRHGSNNFLAHQRLVDRGMMERVLENFEELHSLNQDVLSKQSAAILKRLLAIEADAANGGSYSTSNEELAGDADLDAPCVQQDNHALRLRIPYFGTIRIASEGLSRAQTQPQKSNPPAQSSLAKSPQQCASAGATAASPVNNASSSGVATPATHPGYQIGGDAPGTDWQALPMQFTGQFTPQQPITPFTGIDTSQQQQIYVPGLTAGAEDWAFQGVDMAFFDSLMKGASTAQLPDTGTPQIEPSGLMGSNTGWQNWGGHM